MINFPNNLVSNITFIIFTYNEEKRLPYVLKNFSRYGQICLMDDGSTDRTREIAESSGALYFRRPVSNSVNVETVENFKFIKTFLKTEWIYWGYADNIAPKSLLEKLTEVSKEEKYKQVFIPLYTYLWGNTKNYTLKAYAPFFFHKDYIDFQKNHIHGIGKFLGSKSQILRLPNKPEFALRHFSTYNIEKFVRNHFRYSDKEAQEKFFRGEKFSILKLLRALVAYAWYFTKDNYKNGKLGFLILLNYLSYRIMTYTRLYEIENNITIENIENNYSKKKAELLKDF